MKRLLLIMSIIGITVFVMYMFLYLFALSGAFSILMPKPLKPQITYGEFNCTLTYELDGKVKVINDTIICEFDGFENYGTAGNARKWKTTLKSGNEELTLLNLRQLNETNELGQKILELYFPYGHAEYYMGDEAYGYKPEISPEVAYMYQNTDGTIGHSALKAEEAYERFHIRLISWEASEPIRNNFK